MRKTIVFAVLAVLLLVSGCSVLSKFNPPVWIIGEWSDESDLITYTFSPHDIVSSSTMISLDFAEAFKSVPVHEDATDSLYSVSGSMPGLDYVFRFEKTSPTTVDYYITTNGMTVGPLVLTKQ